MGSGNHLLEGGPQLPGAEGTVDAHHIRAETGEGNGSSCGIGAQKCPAILPEGHSDKDRQIRVFLCGQKSGFGLPEIAHCLNENKVCSGCGAGSHDLCKIIVSFFKGQLSQRSQKRTQRPHIQRHINGTLPAFCRLACQRNAGGNTRAGVLAHLTAAGAKSVGSKDICAGVSIIGVNGGHYVRIC